MTGNSAKMPAAVRFSEKESKEIKDATPGGRKGNGRHLARPERLGE